MSSFSDAKPDERALVIAAQRGSSDRFAALVRLPAASIRGLPRDRAHARRRGRRGAGRVPPCLQGIGPVPSRSAVRRVAVPHHANASLDLVRRRKVRDADELPETIALPFRDPGESDELRRRLNQALVKLTDRQRSVIVLHDVEGFTHGNWRDAGIPEGTARSDLHHARAALRRLLKDVRGDL